MGYSQQRGGAARLQMHAEALALVAQGWPAGGLSAVRPKGSGAFSPSGGGWCETLATAGALLMDAAAGWAEEGGAAVAAQPFATAPMGGSGARRRRGWRCGGRCVLFGGRFD
jgi:hypothetical protein